MILFISKPNNLAISYRSENLSSDEEWSTPQQFIAPYLHCTVPNIETQHVPQSEVVNGEHSPVPGQGPDL